MARHAAAAAARRAGCETGATRCPAGSPGRCVNDRRPAPRPFYMRGTYASRQFRPASSTIAASSDGPAQAARRVRRARRRGRRPGVIDPARSEVRFTVTKLGFSDVTGVFRESSGEIRYDAGAPGGKRDPLARPRRVGADRRVEPRSLAAAARVLRRRAASGPDLREPARRARSRTGALDVTGDITMRGVTRPLTIDVASAHARRPARRSKPTSRSTATTSASPAACVMGRLIGRPRARARARGHAARAGAVDRFRLDQEAT